MSLTFRKAQRSKARLRLGLCGPAGSGKTWSALTLATGIGGRIALIDTENHSGELYANQFDYDILTIEAPFTPEKYVAAIKAAEEAGFNTIITDSLSHAWSGEGGLLDIQGKIADKERNSYTAWRQVTPRHNLLIESMLQSKCHIIATMRSKVEYVLTEETSKSGNKVMVPKKVGMAPVQREGMDYEFTVVLDIDSDHDAKASKDRTSIFLDPLPFRITVETGKKLADWLNEGKEAPKVEAPKPTCGNCRKKDLKTDATETRDGLDLCGPCSARYDELNKK